MATGKKSLDTGARHASSLRPCRADERSVIRQMLPFGGRRFAFPPYAGLFFSVNSVFSVANCLFRLARYFPFCRKLSTISNAAPMKITESATLNAGQ